MMTKVAYLDCPTGISGDMCLGALVDAGVPLEYLATQLERLGIAEEYHLRAESVQRNDQRSTKVHVELLHQSSATAVPHVPQAEPSHQHHSHQHHSHQHHHHDHSPAHQEQHSHQHYPQHHSHSASRNLPAIEQLIHAAHLPQQVTDWSIAIFQQLAAAEGAVHGIAPEQVHFHEVGATDAIVDIVGTCLGLDWLGIKQLYCSALPTGGGTVWAAHGRLPVPAPAVLKLWEMRQVPLYSNGINSELVTPTGAAIVTTLAHQFGPPPPLLLQKVGLGAGAKDLPIPNILRLWIGESEIEDQHQQTAKAAQQNQPEGAQQLASTQETVAVLETQIDDLNPQAIGYTMTELLAAGAFDVFTQAVGMKKSRPGVLLTVICRPEQVSTCEAILFRETTTLGIRHSQQQRTVLSRRLEAVNTPYGKVQVKVARHQGGAIINVQPEYEDCAQLARQYNLPWREVQRLALQSWFEQQLETEVHSSIH
jgi:uncharacterized protein (TIGR00299 family) protein